jgi:hypothetical protein
MALEINFDYQLVHYKVISEVDQIRFQSQFTDLSLIKKECNQHILKNLQSKLHNYLKVNFQDLPVKNGYSIKFVKNIKYDYIENNRARFFINLDHYFKTLKIEEKLSCKI